MSGGISSGQRGRFAAALALYLISLPGCSLRTAAGPDAADISLQELMPHGDRDHFVYVFERLVDGRRVDDGIQVEHVTALAQYGEFEVAVSENGVGIGRARYRDDGRAIVLLSEDDVGQGLRLSYDPPLRLLEVPLYMGERHTTATARVTRLGDGVEEGTLQVAQTIQTGAAPRVETRLGQFENAVLVRTDRTTQGREAAMQLSGRVVLVPGIGEVRSEGSTVEAPLLRRELACATIGGRKVGDCSTLPDELRR